MLSVGVLVTNYNTWPLALACAQEHRRLHGAALARVLLLDDCSPLPPPADLPAEIEIVRNERNLGFSANLNKGIRLLGTDLVLIFDADAFPLMLYLDAVRAAFETDPRLGLLGFRTEDERGAATAAWHPEPGALSLLLGLPLWARWLRWFGRSNGPLCITTAAMAVRRAAFEDVGGFDEQLNWLDVDFDFSMKINRSPWTLRPEPALLARHDYGGTPVSSTDRLVKFYASRWYLLRKYKIIAHAQPAKTLILARLAAEWLFLRLAGGIRHRGDPARHRDKLECRRRLFAYGRRHFA